MKKIAFLLFLCMVGISAIRSETLRTGDLIFQGEGPGEFSKAITAATSRNEEIKFVHVGIIEIDSIGMVNVIEASPEFGVRIVSLDDFIQFERDAMLNTLYVIKRVNLDIPTETVIENARNHIGEAYDWQYLPDNGKMYCSELVCESYIDKNGDKIFNSQPMNFKDSSGEIPDFWINLFEQQHMDVPQGLPGSNPNDLSQNPLLIDIMFNFNQK